MENDRITERNVKTTTITTHTSTHTQRTNNNNNYNNRKCSQVALQNNGNYNSMLISEMLCRNRRWHRLKMHTAQFCASAAAAAAAAAVVVIFFSFFLLSRYNCMHSQYGVCVCVSTLFIVSIAWTDFDRANSSDYMKMVCYVCMHCALYSIMYVSI